MERTTVIARTETDPDNDHVDYLLDLEYRSSEESEQPLGLHGRSGEPVRFLPEIPEDARNNKISLDTLADRYRTIMYHATQDDPELAVAMVRGHSRD